MRTKRQTRAVTIFIFIALGLGIAFNLVDAIEATATVLEPLT